MFTNVSMTGTGLVVSLLSFALPLFGVTVGESQIASLVEHIVQAVGIGLTIWGQLRRPDLSFGLIRK